METWEILVVAGVVIVLALTVGVIFGVLPRLRRGERRVAAPRRAVLAELEDAAARFGRTSGADLELPDPEAAVPAQWAQQINRTAQYVADRQQQAVEQRTERRAALRALRQIQRGVEKHREIEERAADEAREINSITREIGMDPLEITSEAEEEAAFRRLQRANEAAEGTI